MSRLRCRFLQLWQGLLTDGHTRIVVLAATNLPGVLDPAAVRRFGCKLEVGRLPQLQQLATHDSTGGTWQLSYPVAKSEGSR